MKVKISNRESEAKLKKWLSGEPNVFNKERVNCLVNDIDEILLTKRWLSKQGNTTESNW